MTPLRAILLLLCLAAFAPAAPAPFPRDRKPAESNPWSKPVDGLRIRLVAKQGRYRAGHTVRLVMEIQNVRGTAMSTEEPYLSSRISPPDEKPLGWAITAEKMEKEGRKRDCRDRKCCDEAKRCSAFTLLGPGETIRFEIKAKILGRGEG